MSFFVYPLFVPFFTLQCLFLDKMNQSQCMAMLNQ